MKHLLFILTLSLPRQIVAADAPATPQAAVVVPMLGYYYDAAAHRISPVQGIPGAALTGAPVSLPQDATAIAISNERDYALFAGDNTAATLLDLHSGANTSIPGVLPGPSRIVVSPSGVAAALYHATGDLIEVVTGIPAAPIVARTIRTTVLNGQPAILAISDDGQSLAVVDGDGRSLLAMDNDFTVLPVPGAAVALAFSPGTRDILVATGDGQIWSVKEENGQPKYYLIGSEPDKTPFNAEFSGDGSHIFAAFTDGTVAVFDFTGSTPARISCGCSPLAFQRGKGNSVFFLQNSSSPLPQLVDGSAAAPRFLFIPAPVKDNLQ